MSIEQEKKGRKLDLKDDSYEERTVLRAIKVQKRFGEGHVEIKMGDVVLVGDRDGHTIDLSVNGRRYKIWKDDVTSIVIEDCG